MGAKKSKPSDASKRRFIHTTRPTASLKELLRDLTTRRKRLTKLEIAGYVFSAIGLLLFVIMFLWQRVAKTNTKYTYADTKKPADSNLKVMNATRPVVDWIRISFTLLVLIIQWRVSIQRRIDLIKLRKREDHSSHSIRDHVKSSSRRNETQSETQNETQNETTDEA